MSTVRILHDYECGACGEIFERLQLLEQRESVCPLCNHMATRIISYRKSARTVDVFQPYREENLGDDNPEVTSKAHLARLCEERGLYNKGLMEGYRNHGRRREI